MALWLLIAKVLLEATSPPGPCQAAAVRTSGLKDVMRSGTISSSAPTCGSLFAQSRAHFSDWSTLIKAKQCEICHKGTVTGRQVSHAHNVTSRTWEPNLLRVRAVVGGVSRRIRVCARCLRSGAVQKPLVRPSERS